MRSRTERMNKRVLVEQAGKEKTCHVNKIKGQGAGRGAW